jgi:hypothetical protein
MRVAIPDLEQESQIHHTGIGLINLLGTDLFGILNNKLEESEGADWLTKYRKSSLVYLNYNFNDPSNLLKELLRVSASPLRIPIRGAIDQKDLVPFFARLQIILDDRNDWVHHNSTFSKESLKTLILNIYPVAEKFSLSLLNECDFFLPILDGIEPEIPQVDDVIAADSGNSEDSDWVKKIQEVIPENEPAVGELVESKFLAFSYVLHLTGEIRNRKNDQLLSEIRPEVSQNLGALLIARKPAGGRLRITSEGTIVAYFDDHWGYLASVKVEQWFPDHLYYSI